MGLRIGIDEQDLLPHQGQGGGHVDGRRRLADSALLIGDGDDQRTPPGALCVHGPMVLLYTKEIEKCKYYFRALERNVGGPTIIDNAN